MEQEINQLREQLQKQEKLASLGYCCRPQREHGEDCGAR